MKDHLDVKEKHILIIGSESPWIETMALRLGASHVTTGQSFLETQFLSSPSACLTSGASRNRF